MNQAVLAALISEVEASNPTRTVENMVERAFSASAHLGSAVRLYLDGDRSSRLYHELLLLAVDVIDLTLTALPPDHDRITPEVLAKTILVRSEQPSDLTETLFTIQRRHGWLLQALFEARKIQSSRERGAWNQFRTRVTDLISPIFSCHADARTLQTELTLAIDDWRSHRT